MKFQFKIMVTIRNQKDFLKSFYAYDYSHLKDRFKSFDDFISFGNKNRHEFIFRGLHYDLVFRDIADLYGSTNVKFFIYEKMVENIALFLQEILSFIGSTTKIENLDITSKVNVNSEDGIYKLRNVEDSFFSKILIETHQYFKPIVFLFENTKIFQSLRKNVLAYIQKSATIENSSNLEYNLQRFELIVDDIYLESNYNFNQISGLNIEKYGYIKSLNTK